jgi:hypothetical protein
MPHFERRYRPAALADLEDIFRAVLRASPSKVVARRYVERIRALPPDPWLCCMPGARATISRPGFAPSRSSAAP